MGQAWRKKQVGKNNNKVSKGSSDKQERFSTCYRITAKKQGIVNFALI